MAFQLSHIHDYNRFVAIDVGTYRVRAGVYEIEDGEVSLLSSATVRQNRKNIMDGLIVDMRGMAHTVDQAYTQASQKLDQIPQDVILSFSSSAFIIDSVATQYVRGDPESTIMMPEIDLMIKKIEAESFARVRTKAKKQFGISHDDIRLVSSTITTITIDGKNVTNPVGFSGRNVNLTVLNVFVPASEFNIIRSIIASLGKSIISLIPTPLVFPKLLENSLYANENTCIIDIGYSHSTIILTEKSKVITFETFPVGLEMLVEMIATSLPHLSPIQIENLLCSEHVDDSIKDELDTFFAYVIDMFSGFLHEQEERHVYTNLFCHGSFFENRSLFDSFTSKFEDMSGRTFRKRKFTDIVDIPKKQDILLTYGLALMAYDLLVVKKDPLIRILRYILYNYE